MWQQDFNMLDILNMLSIAMQVANDSQNNQMRQQLNRIEDKLDKLLNKLG